jgi:uncharacterized protein YjgD (DUF1641 family)
MNKTKLLIGKLDEIIPELVELAEHTQDTHIIKALNNARQAKDYLDWFEKAIKNAEIRHN